jgi:hypothetical protein
MPRLGQNEVRPKGGMPSRVRLTKGFGLTASQVRLLPTTDMPDRQHIYRVVRDPVVDEVANAAYQ